MLRPLSPNCEHNVRRIKNRVARSDRASIEVMRALWRLAGDLERGFLVADADCEDMFEVVAWALGRG